MCIRDSILSAEETADRFTLPINEGSDVDTLRAEMSHQVLPLGQWPMFDVRLTRVNQQDWHLHLSIDALILDGESAAFLLNEIFTRYHGTSPDSTDELDGVSFRDYVLRLNEDADRGAARTWWEERIATLPPAPALPLACDPDRLEDTRFTRHSDRLNSENWAALQNRATAAGLTPSAVLLSAYAETLAGWTRSAAFSLNITVGDRRREFGPAVANMLGVFTGLVPLGLTNARSGSFIKRARAVQDGLAEALDHRAFSGVEVQRLIAQRAGQAGAGLLPVVFTSLLGEAGFEPVEHGATPVHAITQTPQTWLDLKVYESAALNSDKNDELTIDWDAPTALFPSGLVATMADAFIGLLHRLAEDESAWLETGRSLLPASQAALTDRLNATTTALPTHLLHTSVLKAMSAWPDRPALIEGETSLSFAELELRTRAAARQLNSTCLLYTSPSPRDRQKSRMPSSA